MATPFAPGENSHRIFEFADHKNLTFTWNISGSHRQHASAADLL